MSDQRIPNQSQVEAALLRIPTYQLRRVFYGGLTNPHWVLPLMEAGAFSSPPEPTVTDDGYIQDTYWPELDYLTCVAPEAPEAVVDVLLALESSTNAWVRRATFEIGAAIPAAEGTRLIPLLRAWHPTGFGWRTDPRTMVSFAARLLNSNARKEGRWLANALFKPTPLADDPNRLRSPRFGLEDYWFEEELPKIVPALGEDALKALSGWLTDYLRAVGLFSDEHDISGMTRPSIRDRGDSHRDPENALVEAIRDLAARAVWVDADDTVQILLRHRSVLHRKIAMFAIAEAVRVSAGSGVNPNQLLPAAIHLLSDPESDDEHLRIEYAELAQAMSQVNPDAVSVIGPFLDRAYEVDLERMREAARDGRLVGEHEEDFRDRADSYRHSWLAAIGTSALPPTLQVELEELDTRRGQIDNPLVPLGIVTTWTGPNSHTSQEEMGRMTPAQLVAHLASWHDDGDIWGPRPSHEGQGRELAGLLTAAPMALTGVPDLVDKLRPTYLRAILEGLEAAVKADLELDWEQATSLIDDVLIHPMESPYNIEGSDFDDDRDFRATKKAAIGLLEELIKHRDLDPVPLGFRRRFAQLLINAPSDDAWNSYDSFEPQGDWDPLTLSLNYEWPKRIRALIFAATAEPDPSWKGDALKALAYELTRDDRHGAGDAALGEGFGRLLARAGFWLDLRIEAMIGSHHGLTRRQQITLTTILSTHRYHPELFDALQSAVLGAISVGEALVAGWDGDSKPLPRLGEWLIDAVILGHKSFDDPEVKKFFAETPARVRGDALGKVAWRFLHATSVDDTIRDRFGGIWDNRLAHVHAHPEDSAELSGIFWLAKAAAFPPEWWLPRLRAALALAPEIANERYMLGKELAAASAENPREALEVLKVLLDERHGSGLTTFDLSMRAVPSVIANALRSGDDTLMRDAETYMNELGARGSLDLDKEVRSLLDGTAATGEFEDE
ncbi:hypothetical protein CSX12_11000 [Microbacterium sp. Y-01]|uniref:hypothetical protein n=1 Tax=Microbacterium sp. Y-01 TaxID=2048898 RepID=UPI000F5F31FA|nr:hypothetical protein [Microbacterium sp. Y-01]AZH78954.1 hypothetical protein CSX12_11000 [Microbacterium sp. Y-01]